MQQGTLLLPKVFASPEQRVKPWVPDHMRIYAVGDVHGRVDLLAETFAAIDASLKAYPVKRAIQVMVGDYIDRGPNSREVIEALIARRRHHAMIYLKGNHESFALEFLDDPALLPEWKKAGGLSTLLSYGVRPSLRDDPENQKKTGEAFRQALPESHRRFLGSLALSFTCGNFFFTHAGVRPGIPLRTQYEHDLLWIREDFLLHEDAYDKIIVHGHTPANKPEFHPNRINIDTGAFATGRLTCLVLQGDKMAVI